ncbi:MAG TPA: right-handed parallel beta-helix repeat-containing protein [Draconibacterium sp.]|nr:right-handed parallel beta-helix repeat-containing protein [Draconibacterium sp.]HRX11409.1 right-handed parallel beta-helix repeat-containing protein [Draconibacterium sp.]
MKANVTVLFVFLSFIVNAQQIQNKADALVSPKMAQQVLTVGGQDADVHGYTNQSIQFAIDAVAKTGGTVKLGTGKFDIKAPVKMRSNVQLVGSGKETILKRGAGVQTKYIVDADFGELKLTVENADGFETGMKVQITDDENSGCWNVSTAYITDILDNIIYIDKGLIRDYRSDKNGLVSNASSVIEALDVENCSISNLTADGSRAVNFFADGCNSAGILILRSKNVTVDNVHVKDFNGEGISWQITENVTIKNSEISGSGNTGLHPGTGSPFSIIENNDIHHNDNDGLFICWRVYQSRVSNNKMHDNGRFGICTGHKDVDVVFSENHIFNNKSDGVNLRGEQEANAPHRNTFVKNVIENNSGYGFSVNSKANDLLLKENIFKNTAKTQKAAIYIYENGSTPKLENNQFEKHELGEMVFQASPGPSKGGE